MIYLLVGSLMFLFFLNLFLKKGDLLYPGTIQVGIWFFVTFLYMMNIEFYHEVNPLVYIIILMSCAMFSVGCLATSGGGKRKSSILISKAQIQVIDKLSDILVIIAIISLFLIYCRAREITEDMTGVIAYVKLRQTINYGEPHEGYNYLRYLFPLTCVSGICVIFSHILEDKNRFKKRIIVIFIIGIIMAFLYTSRTHLLIFLLLFGTPFYYFKTIKLSTFLAIFIGLFTILFVIIGQLLGKQEFDIDSFVLAIASYIVAPLVAFSGQLTEIKSFEVGANTFRTIFAILYSFGISAPPKPLIQPFTDVPVETNLYTSFHPYYLDYGIFGVLFIQLLIGMCHGYFYRLVSNDSINLFRVFLFLVSLLPLFSIYSTEGHFMLLSLWMQFLLLGLLVFHHSRKLKNLIKGQQ